MFESCFLQKAHFHMFQSQFYKLIFFGYILSEIKQANETQNQNLLPEKGK